MNSDQAKVRMAKIPVNTNHFRENQKVWMVYGTGDEAALVVGKYRGKGRYVSAWIRWDGSKPKPKWNEIEVDRSFAEKHRIMEVQG